MATQRSEFLYKKIAKGAVNVIFSNGKSIFGEYGEVSDSEVKLLNLLETSLNR
ncbi:MAG: hypothetical protein ACPH8R_01150 [Luminiphilus sp.]